MKTLILTVVTAAVLSLVAYASAQDIDNDIPTDLPGVTTALAPPAGFNPLEASDDELAAYGLPPRSDESDNPPRLVLNNIITTRRGS